MTFENVAAAIVIVEYAIAGIASALFAWFSMTEFANQALYLAEKYSIPVNGGKKMLEYKKHLSETAVDDFIEAVRIIAENSGGIIRISSRDETMMREHLVAQPVDGKGINVDICPRKADIRSSAFEATWSRR